MKGKKASVWITGIVLVLVAVIFIAFNLVGVKSLCQAETLQVKAVLFQEEVAYTDIADLQLQEDISFGTRTFGMDAIGVKTGDFSNDAFGTYRCAVYASVPVCIVLEKKDGTFLVFNAKTAEQTQSLFETLQAKLP